MNTSKDIPERIARLEAISEQYDRRIKVVEKAVEDLKNHVSSIDIKLSKLEATLQSVKGDIEESNKRSMWKTSLVVGVLISAVNILINLAMLIH